MTDAPKPRRVPVIPLRWVVRDGEKVLQMQFHVGSSLTDFRFEWGDVPVEDENLIDMTGRMQKP
jgi:hypothetical protein